MDKGGDDSITLERLIDLYKKGPRFNRLANGTQSNYCRAFDALDTALNRMKVDKIKRRDIKQRLDKKLI